MRAETESPCGGRDILGWLRPDLSQSSCNGPFPRMRIWMERILDVGYVIENGHPLKQYRRRSRQQSDALRERVFLSLVVARLFGAWHDRFNALRLVSRGADFKSKLAIFLAAVVIALPRRWIPRLDSVVDNFVRGSRARFRNRVYGIYAYDNLYGLGEHFETEISHWFNVSGDLFLDVGANIGLYTMLLAPRFKEVIAFEPLEGAFEALNAGIKINGFENVKTVNAALWSRSGDGVLIEATQSGLSTLVLEVPKKKGCHLVRLLSADEVVDHLKVDLVKIDAEGAEAEVLEGMQHIVASSKPRIVVEVKPENTDRVYTFMAKHHYRLAERFGENHLFLPR